MKTLTKALLIAAPLAALVLYYVIMQQSKVDTSIKKQDAIFERSWNEFDRDLSKTNEAKTLYQQRADKAQAELTDLEKKEKEKEEKADKFQEDFEKEINKLDKKKEGK